MLAPSIRELAGGLAEYDRRAERRRCEDSLHAFVETAWRYIDPAPFIDNWHIGVICDELEKLAGLDVPRDEWQYYRDLVVNLPPRSSKTNIISVAFPAWVWCQPKNRWNVLLGPKATFLCVSYGSVFAEVIATRRRRLIAGEWYQGHWGGRVKIRDDQSSRADFGNAEGGEMIANSIEGGILGRGGLYQIIDDPSKIDEVESDVERRRMLQALREGLPSRVTNPRLARRVLTAQRLHQDDATNYALDNWPSGTLRHLCFRARYEESNPTYRDPREVDGEPMYPALWGDRELRKLERELGPYACTPGESPVLMADLSLRPIRDIKAGDEVIGFAVDPEHKPDAPANYRRQRLMITTVKEVFAYDDADTVEMTLDSGETIRCTPDHKWYRRLRNGEGRPAYLPAHVGTALARVCVSSMKLGHERVVAIRPFGKERVHALKTGTGNYVVWGLASSNSASQLQQRPEPRGGGIIKREWWRLWPDDAEKEGGLQCRYRCDHCGWQVVLDFAGTSLECRECGRLAERVIEFPQFSFRVLSVDTNYGDKEMNSYSAATLWSIWHDESDAPRVILTEAWRGRPQLRTGSATNMGLVERIYSMATRRSVDVVLIERKTRGQDLYDELDRLTREYPFRLEFFDPTGRGDKSARLNAVVPLFTNDLVWAPAKAWAEMVIDEVVSQTPDGRAKFNDFTDTCSMVLLWMRQNGYLSLKHEHAREKAEASYFRGRTERFSVVEQYEG